MTIELHPWPSRDRYLTVMIARSEARQPVEPCAKTIRDFAVTLGLSDLIVKVNTGQEHCRVKVRLFAATRFAALLRPLWGDQLTTVLVEDDEWLTIRREGWEQTLPSLARAADALFADGDGQRGPVTTVSPTERLVHGKAWPVRDRSARDIFVSILAQLGIRGWVTCRVDPPGSGVIVHVESGHEPTVEQLDRIAQLCPYRARLRLPVQGSLPFIIVTPE